MELLTADVDGPMHYADHGGPADAPVVVLVHGLGASHLSWLPLAERLIATHRVIAPDLVGFGHSAPEGRGAGVTHNRRHLARFLREVVGEPSLLVGNSMGGMVSAMVAHDHPDLVRAVALVDPAVPTGLSRDALRQVDPQMALFFALYSTPFVAERFLRLRRSRTSARRQVELLLAGVCADPSRVDPRVVDQLVDLTEARRAYDWADAAFLEAERSIIRTLTVGRRRYLTALRGLGQPTLLVHGEADGLVPVAAARHLAGRTPGIELVTLPDVGHAPQLEVPDQLADVLLSWDAGAGTARSA